MTPSASPARNPGRALVAVAACLAAAGCVLVALALSSGSPAARRTPSAAVSGPASPAGRAGSASPITAPTPRTRPVATPTVSASSASPSATASELPPPGSGPSADPIVQHVLDQAIPADLPAATAKRLTVLGRAVWTAEVTGGGRNRWPRYFIGTGQSAVYTRVRIQAAIARQAGSTNRAVVRLVWAGADPSSTYLDGRTATVRFTREGDTWNPVR